MKAALSTGFPSEGRRIFPFVGPLGAASRSIMTLVITFEYLPPPRLSSLAPSYGSHPVAKMTAPTLRIIVFPVIVRSIALYLQTSTHFAHWVS